MSERALRAVLAGNLRQDEWRGLLRAEHHFDSNQFDAGLAYIEANRSLTALAVEPAEAWAAFGRLTHAAQDFYSHSTYVALWAERYDGLALPPVDAIDGLDPALLRHPRLRSGRIYPIEILWFFRRLHPLVKRLTPHDAHAWMNLDGPWTGPYFPYSLTAAAQRTAAEFERTLAAIGEERGEEGMRGFCDL